VRKPHKSLEQTGYPNHMGSMIWRGPLEGG
jgi:hypothetical protein